MPAFQPYWGKPAVRNERGDRGNVGIIRSPVRASILPDCGGRSVMGVPTAIENNRLADEIARLRALLTPDAAQARAETEQQMKDLKTALLDLLDQASGNSLH